MELIMGYRDWNRAINNEEFNKVMDAFLYSKNSEKDIITIFSNHYPYSVEICKSPFKLKTFF